MMTVSHAPWWCKGDVKIERHSTAVVVSATTKKIMVSFWLRQFQKPQHTTASFKRWPESFDLNWEHMIGIITTDILTTRLLKKNLLRLILRKFSYSSVAVIPPRCSIVSPNSFFRRIESPEPDTSLLLDGIFDLICVPLPWNLPHTSL